MLAETKVVPLEKTVQTSRMCFMVRAVDSFTLTVEAHHRGLAVPKRAPTSSICGACLIKSWNCRKLLSRWRRAVITSAECIRHAKDFELLGRDPGYFNAASYDPNGHFSQLDHAAS
jgi:hypothetical protein